MFVGGHTLVWLHGIGQEVSGFFQFCGSVETIQNTFLMSRISRKGLTFFLHLHSPAQCLFNIDI